MRRILTLLFVAALLLTPGYAPIAHAQPSAQVAITGTVIKTANLRAGPGTTFAIVGSAQAGQPVTILGTNAAGDPMSWQFRQAGQATDCSHQSQSQTCLIARSDCRFRSVFPRIRFD